MLRPRRLRGGTLPFALAWACAGFSLGCASFVCTYLPTRGQPCRITCWWRATRSSSRTSRYASPTPPVPYVPPCHPVLRIRWGKDRPLVLGRRYARGSVAATKPTQPSTTPCAIVGVAPSRYRRCGLAPPLTWSAFSGEPPLLLASISDRTPYGPLPQRKSAAKLHFYT